MAETTSTSVREPKLLHEVGAVVGAVVAATAIWLVAQLTGTELRVTIPGQSAMTIGPIAVVAVSLGAALVGWLALAVLRRFTSRARAVWTGLAIAGLALSLVPLLTVSAEPVARLFLALMHVGVATVLIVGLRRATTPAEV